MKLRKLNAILSLLAIPAMFLHIGYSTFAYLTFYYNPGLKNLTAMPFMVLACLHAVLGMSILFLQPDGTRADLYPKQNIETIIQRVTAALIFPLLILHLRTFDLLSSSAEGGNWPVFWIVLLVQPLFYAVVMTHASLSMSRALITMGWLSSRKTQKTIDLIMGILSAAVFLISSWAVIHGELAMFMH